MNLRSFYVALSLSISASAQVYAPAKRQYAAFALFPVTTLSRLETKSDCCILLKATACQQLITISELGCFTVSKDSMMCADIF